MSDRETSEELSGKRGSTNVAVSPYANEMITAWKKRSGGSKTRLLEVLLEFFGSAPQSMQQALYGVVPEDMLDAYVKHASDFFAEYMRKSAENSKVAGAKIAGRIGAAKSFPDIPSGEDLVSGGAKQSGFSGKRTRTAAKPRKSKRGGEDDPKP